MLDTMQNVALDFLCFGVLFSIPVVLGVSASVFFTCLLHTRNKV